MNSTKLLQSKTILASAARTATASSADQTCYGRGVRVFIHVSAAVSSPSVVPTIEVKDSVSGEYATLLTGAAITGEGLTALVVYPGITAATNVAVSMVLGSVFRVTMTHGNTNSITYTVAAVQIP